MIRRSFLQGILACIPLPIFRFGQNKAHVESAPIALKSKDDTDLEIAKLHRQIKCLQADLRCVRSTLAADYAKFGAERCELQSEIHRLQLLLWKSDRMFRPAQGAEL